MSAPQLTGIFTEYLSALRKTFVDEKTEHTDRHAVKALLERFAPKGITIVHEPKRIIGAGAPDFKIRQNGRIVGYVETKPIGTDLQELRRVLKSDQICRYRALSPNLILTDYLNWMWLKDGNIQSGTLCDLDILSSRKSFPEQANLDRVSSLLSAFLSVTPQTIAHADELADLLAIRTRFLRDFLGAELARQDKENQGERLYGLYHAFKQQVSAEITLAEFADAFAQTLSYGLFLSKLNANGYSLHLGNAKQYIPKSFRLIEELVGFLDELDDEFYKDIKWVVDEVLSITNGIDVWSVKEDLSFRNRKRANRSLKAKDEEEWRLFSRDPFIYFYENFLSQYDPQLRKQRGVYYTPPPVVNFIVRGVDDILRGEFKLKSGLANSERVTVLEFACGTGTFIIEVIQRILENLEASQGAVDLALQEHILKNVFAFEYLIAPYTIAHLKLAQYLEDRQIKIADDHRFNIFLTNTLEPLEPQNNFLLPALSEETKRASAVKNRPILVITGNPPYAGESKNKGKWITAAIEDYKFTMEKTAQGNLVRTAVRERNLKWLHDDYVKFIRFAQMKMDASPEGVVAIITNHSYLDNPTFPGMRDSLMRSFDQIRIVDFHGSSKPKESAPDGLRNENIFDIQKGVAVAFLIKKAGAEKGVWRADVWGTRAEKYRFAASTKLSELEWTKLNPQSPDYLFVHQNHDLKIEYHRGFSVTDIFPVNGTGIITKRDSLCIHFDEAEVWETVKSFAGATAQEARKLFNLPKDVRDWKVSWAQKDVRASGPKRDSIQAILYRPFDTRYTYYTGHARGFIGWPVERLMRHLRRPNVGLITSRLTKGEKFAHVQVTDKPTEVICMSPETSNNGFLFPLYLYAPDHGESISLPDLFDKADPFNGKEKIENISPRFRAWLSKTYKVQITAEQILGFVYATLHATTYRERFEDFLKRDFPRILFPSSTRGFTEMAELGCDLVEKHLLKDVPSCGLAEYHVTGTHVIEKITYSAPEKAVYINDTQRFNPVPIDVWQFRVGGYQVIEKYLKSRKGRRLTLCEIQHLTQIANSIGYTVAQMKKIEAAYQNMF